MPTPPKTTPKKKTIRRTVRKVIKDGKVQTGPIATAIRFSCPEHCQSLTVFTERPSIVPRRLIVQI